MVELAAVITALSAYRARLKADGKLLKAMAVARRSRLVLARRDIGWLRLLSRKTQQPRVCQRHHIQ